MNVWHNLTITRKGSIFNYLDFVNILGCKMMCVYFVVYYLLPKKYYQQKYGVFIVYSIASLLFFTGLNICISITYVKLMNPGATITWFNASLQMLTHLIDFSQALVLFVIVFLIEHYVKREQINKTIEKERIESELNFLRAQMNPHFLFNALNSIYFLIDSDHDRSKEILIKFSDLLRYQLYDCSIEKTTLDSEIKFIQDYIGLEKIRNNETLFIEFNVSGKTEEVIISPLLLIPFVENAFKYISHYPDGDNFVRISISVQDNVLEFMIENSFTLTTSNASGGIGISNVKRRLELLYPKLYNLKISNDDSVFKVQLNLILK